VNIRFFLLDLKTAHPVSSPIEKRDGISYRKNLRLNYIVLI
jgi:hypothetical protein